MRVAENWKDYKIIDTSTGEKLESWNGYKLIRPDPQVIWKTPHIAEEWETADARYIRSKKGGGEWQFNNNLPDYWNVSYKNLKFKIHPTGFKHTGLFPEQAVNWDFIEDKIKSDGRQINVLNLFAYTGGATLAAADAGAKVCHVDAAKGMVNWARENAALSGLSDKPVRWIVDDCEKFVSREIRRGRKYDAVIMDPPSYGRGPGGEIWRIEDSIYELVSLCKEVLSDDPLFFMINSYTTGLSPTVMGYILNSLFKDMGGEVLSDEIGLPVEKGFILPCGATAIWYKK